MKDVVVDYSVLLLPWSSTAGSPVTGPYRSRSTDAAGHWYSCGSLSFVDTPDWIQWVEEDVMTRKLPPYPKEFRAEAVRLVLEQGLSLREASQRLAVAKGTLSGWVANARDPQAQKAPGSRSVAELESEVSSLRKELA